ncbi:MAG: hypothetical protein QOH08_596 [Chloroflexota bacterium]|jgi:hypothetical protein|nr:hypothetical protein [Chloroflexota bacterium]
MKAPIGFEGRSVQLPGHICLFYKSEDELRRRQAAFLRFAVDGKREGIVLMGGTGIAETLYRYLEVDLGVDLSTRRDAGMIALAHGDVDVDEQLENVIRPIEAMIEGGAKLVRLVGRVQWGGPDYAASEDVVWYESKLNDRIAGLPVVLVCAYDIFELPGEALILGGLHSHPQLLCGTFSDRNTLVESTKRHLQLRMAEFPWLTEVDSSGGG